MISKRILFWFCNNKEWLFSGIGLTIITGLLRMLQKKRNNTKTMIKQINNGKKNTQIGIQNNYSVGEENE